MDIRGTNIMDNGPLATKVDWATILGKSKVNARQLG
jgi:hypothetical protein